MQYAVVIASLSMLATAVSSRGVDDGSNAFQHDLYVGATTGQILRMSLGTATTPPQWQATITPGSGGITQAFTDPSQNYAYFVASSSTTANLIRVNMATGAYAGTVQIPRGESASAGQMNGIYYGGIDSVNHYAYLTNVEGLNSTHSADNPDAPEIYKINLQTAFKNTTGNSTPINGTDYSILDLSSTVAGQGIGRAGFNDPAIDEGITIDAAHGYAYVGTYNSDNTGSTLNQNTWPYNQSIVARISLGTAANGANFPANPVAGILTLNVGERDLTTGLLDPANGNIYFGSDNVYPAHVYMIHVGDGTQPMSEIGRLNLNVGTAVPYPPGGILDGETHSGSNATQYGEIYLRSGIINPATNTLYYGTDTTPGQVIQVDINQVPEPAGAAMLTLGAGGVLLRRRVRNARMPLAEAFR